jgi:ATP-binding cassette subfamily B protein
VDADEIIVLVDGRVAERGIHPELLRGGGLYASMWERQQRGFDEAPAEPSCDERVAAT